jgi:hypothetical protein
MSRSRALNIRTRGNSRTKSQRKTGKKASGSRPRHPKEEAIGGGNDDSRRSKGLYANAEATVRKKPPR